MFLQMIGEVPMSAISVRLADSLHRKVREAARRTEFSINQFISTAVAEKLSALLAEDVLEARARRGTRAKFERALSKVPDVEPALPDALPERSSSLAERRTHRTIGELDPPTAALEPPLGRGPESACRMPVSRRQVAVCTGRPTKAASRPAARLPPGTAGRTPRGGCRSGQSASQACLGGSAEGTVCAGSRCDGFTLLSHDGEESARLVLVPEPRTAWPSNAFISARTSSCESVGVDLARTRRRGTMDGVTHAVRPAAAAPAFGPPAGTEPPESIRRRHDARALGSVLRPAAGGRSREL